ncbi:MAG: lipoyl(octanoyl) transferase LipB, partial [Caldiserica bacterium]|nr:lipoyl(octanoyl) transferase LipB [Caldisericota bacterium]
MKGTVLWAHLGRIPYDEALELQRDLHRRRCRGEIGDLVLSLEHEPVITLGRSADPRHVLADPAALLARGIRVRQSERGGDVTYHGPGQLVLYPILDLRGWGRRLRWYVWALEEVMLRVAAAYGIDAARIPGRPGIWVGRDKLGAVGVYVRRWVTMHGLALNVDPDPDGFRWIVPCGVHGAGTT